MNKQIAALATDEKNIVMWDMDALLLDCQDRPYTVVDTERLIPQSWLTIDERYAMTTDVTKPILVFALPDGQWYIADGNHRLYRAAAEKIPTMRVILVPQEMHLSYLFRSSVEDYHRVVEGLKDEGIFVRALGASIGGN